MNADKDNRIEKVRLLLAAHQCDFIVIYRVTQSKAGVNLKQYRTATMVEITNEELDKLAAKYQPFAMDCYRREKDQVFSENIVTTDMNGQSVPPTIVLNSRPNPPNPGPANSLGRRWWHLVVAAGATQKAGYAIVARVAAREANEVQDCIDKIQSIMKKN